MVTYGAGSGVVLGNRAARGGVALVLRTHLNQLLAIDELNQTAVVQPGMMGPTTGGAERAAPRRFGTSRAFTGGHFPQSFEIASVSGWILAAGSGRRPTTATPPAC
ncbi:MAG: FAD-binding protein [Candidatus Binatia bacterium]